MRFWFRGGNILVWSTIFCLYANSFRGGGRTAAAGVISSKGCGEGRDIVVVLDLGTELAGISVFGRLTAFWREEEGWTDNLDRGLRGVENLGRANVLRRPREDVEVWVLARWVKGEDDFWRGLWFFRFEELDNFKGEDDFWRGLWFFRVEELDNLKERCWPTEDVTSGFPPEDRTVGVTFLITLPVRSVLLLQGDSASGDDERDRWDRFLFPMTTVWLVGESEAGFCVEVSFEIASFKAFLVASIWSGTAWRSGSKGKTADRIVPCLSSKIWMAWIWVWRAWECVWLNCEKTFRKHWQG